MIEITILARHAHDWLIRQGWKINEELSHPTQLIYISPDGSTGYHCTLDFCVNNQMIAASNKENTNGL